MEENEVNIVDPKLLQIRLRRHARTSGARERVWGVMGLGVRGEERRRARGRGGERERVSERARERERESTRARARRNSVCQMLARIPARQCHTGTTESCHRVYLAAYFLGGVFVLFC